MGKRLFEILDEMNQFDTKHDTRLVEVSNNLISAEKVKGGVKVSMGAPEATLINLLDGTKIPLLLMVDKETYFKLKDK